MSFFFLLALLCRAGASWIKKLLESYPYHPSCTPTVLCLTLLGTGRCESPIGLFNSLASFLRSHHLNNMCWFFLLITVPFPQVLLGSPAEGRGAAHKVVPARPSASGYRRGSPRGPPALRSPAPPCHEWGHGQVQVFSSGKEKIAGLEWRSTPQPRCLREDRRHSAHRGGTAHARCSPPLRTAPAQPEPGRWGLRLARMRTEGGRPAAKRGRCRARARCSLPTGRRREGGPAAQRRRHGGEGGRGAGLRRCLRAVRRRWGGGDAACRSLRLGQLRGALRASGPCPWEPLGSRGCERGSPQRGLVRAPPRRGAGGGINTGRPGAVTALVSGGGAGV